MASIVYQTGKNGTRYAYLSESFWDATKKSPRSKRTYLGKVDENGEIVVTSRSKITGDVILDDLRAKIAEKDQVIAHLRIEIADLKKENSTLISKQETMVQELNRFVTKVNSL